MPFLTHLECSACGQQHSHAKIQNLCICGKPLLARYNLEKISELVTPNDFQSRPADLWRYRELLPDIDQKDKISLGEGFTPLLSAANTARSLGIKRLLIKDESLNPTLSFKARGMTVAVSMAKKLGIGKLCVPSAGNAGSAASAYAARAGLELNLFMPDNTEPSIKTECSAYGVNITYCGQSIADAARLMNEIRHPDWFDLSTLKEPYRVEGKKTMGLELAEQLDWQLPDAIFYPTGGGTGLIGMQKAFREMQELGWVDKTLPRMYAIQSEGCAPIVKAFREGKQTSEVWPDPQTAASGIKVPQALGDYLILKGVRESRGAAVAVSEKQIESACRLLAQSDGILLCPEGSAALAGLLKLKELESTDLVTDTVVVFNTGSALKYQTFLDSVFGRQT